MEAETLRRHPVRLAVWLAIVGLLTVLNFVGRLAESDSQDDLAYRYTTAITAFAFYGVLLVIMLVIARVAPRMPVRDAFALRPPVSWRHALGLVAGALLAVYAFVIAYGWLLSLFTDANPSCEQGLAPTEWDPSRAGAFAAFAVSVIVLGPIVEELLYRGLGFGLVVPYSALLAILVTGLLFAASHGLVYGFLPLAAFGIVLGCVRGRTDSTYPAMVMHSTFNGVSLVIALAVSSSC